MSVATQHRIEFIVKDDRGQLQTVTITCENSKYEVDDFARDLRKLLEKQVEAYDGWTVEHVRDYPLRAEASL